MPANQASGWPVLACGNPSTVQPIIVTFKKQRGRSNFNIALYIMKDTFLSCHTKPN